MSGREKIWKQGDPPANWRACDHAQMSKLVLLSALVLAQERMKRFFETGAY